MIKREGFYSGYPCTFCKLLVKKEGFALCSTGALQGVTSPFSITRTLSAID
jgi:hypothetical protein